MFIRISNEQKKAAKKRKPEFKEEEKKQIKFLMSGQNQKVFIVSLLSYMVNRLKIFREQKKKKILEKEMDRKHVQTLNVCVM